MPVRPSDSAIAQGHNCRGVFIGDDVPWDVKLPSGNASTDVDGHSDLSSRPLRLRAPPGDFRESERAVLARRNRIE